MKSIFEIENRLDINNEFEKIISIIYEDSHAALYSKDAYHSKEYGTLIEAINKKIFLKWQYRDTFLDVEEYLEHIGIDYEEALLYREYFVNEIAFLNFLEFLANMFLMIAIDDTIELSMRINAVKANIPRILEKMNYELKQIEDKIIITKRNADVDSILDIVPKNIADVLLEYNDFRIQGDIKAKQKILKNIDLYIEKNINIKSFDKDLDNSIGTIVNKMGINHPIKEEPYKTFTEQQLIQWYDKCFLMMMHAIRTTEINKIKNERKELLNN